MIIVKFNKTADNFTQPASDPFFYSPGIIQWHHPRSPSWRPPTDVFETENAIVIRVEIPGMEKDDINISLDNYLLSIYGTRSDTAEKKIFQQMEILFGDFNVAIELPTLIATDNIDAEYINGMLIVIVPKSSPKEIKISS